MQDETLSATVSAVDAFGVERRVTVEWMPMDITAEMTDAPNSDEFPERTMIGADKDVPPVWMRRSPHSGNEVLVARVENLAGSMPLVHEWAEVEDRNELEPGTYWIAADTSA